ncbi:hypothetical protein BH10CYA1_BH10CYA1_28010 [soil metagenome]
MNEKLLVTDTHPILYFFCDGGKRLGKKALVAFQEALAGRSTSIFVPIPALWEISLLVESGNIELGKSFSDWIEELFKYPSFNPVPFEIEAVKIFHDVRYHNDPFDRAIVATALQMGLPLITNDGKMHANNPCHLFWD